MCIINVNIDEVRKQKSRSGQLMLWKVVRKDNRVGLWAGTYGEDHQFNLDRSHDVFVLGVNFPHKYGDLLGVSGRFHCFLTREAARDYLKQRAIRPFYARPNRSKAYAAKVIKVYADRVNVVHIGLDMCTKLPAISVSKMEVKSLKHQR